MFCHRPNYNNWTAAAEGHTETGIDAIKSSVSFGDWFLKLKKYKCEGLPLSRNVLSLLSNIDNWQTRDDWSLNYTAVFHFQSFIHPPPTHLSLASLSQSSDYHLSGFGCQFINRWLLCLQRNLLLRPLFKALVGKQGYISITFSPCESSCRSYLLSSVVVVFSLGWVGW